MTQFWLIFLVAVVIVALSFAGLSIKILLEKRGKFPNMHIGSNEYLKSQGITCAQTYDKIEQAKAREELSFKELSILKDNPGSC
ncbi:MAG TPA: hypothetical protein VKA27_01510 [Sunxiuqinia sp.]|nr:hypothetical protein [Sunxiuqinia sp.]